MNNGFELKTEQYFKPVIEIVAVNDISLDELIVACFHCDPAGPGPRGG